ncbi:N-acetylmannosamine-6-phosphate 2-epimerase [Ornithinimicrobium pekingense]|uniref:Putative N-acetylmannosamine-6-phosphate 2-epimerase n=1 Tax=Ornithinimicrobium pekingense TaxID=384677 RepID=A0ABQ2FAM8_9MICO|nr:putative N-acetylmannosamine-6-phosphate 2-epimerase [Ornithinimicrobium pekingense]GGK77678.1 putative N-acetylmannosamine-6-phosphate 2-epimerase [Ornithinimicrobium pekingense]
MTTHPDDIVTALRGRLVVSCQAYPGEPLRSPEVMAAVAAAVVEGGAAAVRVQGVEDVRAAVERVDVPVVGLWKDGDAGVYITPTLRHARAVAEAGAHVVAVDATLRTRQDGSTFADTVRMLHEEHGVLVMADCDDLASAVAAAEAGADLVGTTLAGYTAARPRTEGPDLELLREVTAALPGHPVVAEGRIHTHAHAAAALAAGAHAVCVGTAITHPTSLTRWFVDAMGAG